MDKQDAIQRLKTGDIGGLEMLVSKYQVRAVRTAFLITHDAGMAEDVVQDAFLQTYRSIRHFDQNRPFAAWFMRNVINTAVKAAQKETRWVIANSASDDRTLEDWLPTGTSVEQQVESSEFQQRVWDAMQNLSPPQRAVIVQRYFLDASEKEIAVDLAAAPGTVKWLLHTARKNLRSLLSERIEK